MGEAEAIEQTRENLEIAEEHEAQRSERIQVKWCLRNFGSDRSPKNLYWDTVYWGNVRSLTGAPEI